MMTPIVLSVTCMKKKVLIPLINISYMESAGKSGKSKIVLDDETVFEVEESIDQIETSLYRLDLVKRPSNIEG